MPSPTIEAQIDQYINSPEMQGAYTLAEIDAMRTYLMDIADRAEAGDNTAQAQLASIGITIRTGGFWDWLRSAMPGGTATAPGGPFYGWGEQPTQQPRITQPPTATVTEESTPALPEGYQYLGLGQVKYIDPDTGRVYFYQMTDAYGDPVDDPTMAAGLKPLSNAEVQAGATAGWSTASLRDLQYALDQGMITEEQYANQLASRLLSTPSGTAAITPYQQAQLDISRQRLGLDVQEAERNWLQTQIEAARTGQPLTYLGLLRGQVPGAGGTELYQGISPTVPTLAGQTTGGTWEAPAQFPALATVQSGGVLKSTGLPSGTLKVPGVTAQAAMTPAERSAYGEVAEYAGIPSMDWEAYLRRTRTAIGQGLSPYSYGGINVRR